MVAAPPAPSLLPLRDYQRAALDAILAAEREGVTRQLVAMPTGSGKTALASHLIRETAQPRGWVTVFVVHRDELARQSVAALGQVNPDLAVGVCKAERDDLHANVIVASAQTLAQRRRLDRLVAATRQAPGLLWVSDECFPAGTLVGRVPIEQIEVGDMVPAFDETSGRVVPGRVTRLFRRRAPRLMVRVTADAFAITCTANHPIFTARGWQPAGQLSEGDTVYVHDESLQAARSDLHRMPLAVHHHEEGTARHMEAVGQCLLLTGLPADIPVAAIVGADGRDEPHPRERAHAGAQPDGTAGGSAAHGGVSAGDWAQAARARRQRQRADRAAAQDRRGVGLADGVCGAHGSAAAQPRWPECCLQDRCGESSGTDRGGSGWQHPLRQGPGAGREEDTLPRTLRVDRVEVLESGDPGGLGSLCPDGLVYNIEVEHYHTYIAGGIVVHNCHHDLAPSRVRAISESAPDLLVGLTATPERGDGGRLGNIYQQITFQVGMLELMARGRLARLVGVRVGTDVSLDAVRTTAGELNEGDLEHAVDTPERNRLIVAGWRRHAATRTRTVVFCVTVAHAEHVAEAFAAAGVSVATVFGHTPTEQRQETFRRFHEGEIRVLVNVMVLTEGYDEPAIDCVIVARPTKSRGLYVQMVGRGARTFPDKQDCLVLDVVDISSRHKLVGMAALTSDRSELAGAVTDDQEPAPAHDQPFDLLERAEALERRRRAREERQARLTAEADAGKARLAAETKAVNLYAASPWLWHESKGVHYAPAGDGTWLVVQPHPDGFRPYLLQSDRTTREANLTELFDRSLDFEMAMGIAHDRAPRLPAKERKLYDRAATWRTETAPPSPAQIAAAQKWRIPLTGRETKAEVSKLMDEAAFGAAHWRATRGRNR